MNSAPLLRPCLMVGAGDLAAHIVVRERDLVAGLCLVPPGPCQRFAERRRVKLAQSKDFKWIVTHIRRGPPLGFFRIGWVRRIANLNEFFIHHVGTSGGPVHNRLVSSRPQ